MRAIKEARKFIQNNPGNAAAITLSRLVLALEKEVDFPISDIYLLDYTNFKLALEILQEWRLDRHYVGKSKLYDASLHLAGLTPAQALAKQDTSIAPTPLKPLAEQLAAKPVAKKPAAGKAAKAPKKAATPKKAASKPKQA